MTTDGIAIDAAVVVRREPSAVWALARLEGRRHLRNPVLWLGIGASVYATWRSSSIDWNAGPYSAFPADLVPAAWALFVLGSVSGGRDHLPGLRPSPAAAVATGEDRIAAGRLLGLLAPLAVVAALVVGIVAVVRVSGGYVIGEATWRTTDAQLTVPEIAQPLLLATVSAAAGVAVGRATRQKMVAVVAGTVVLFAFGLISWAWQWSPAVYLAPVQQQPFSVELDRPLTDVPAGWWLSSPGEYQDDWRRLVVDPVVATGHDLVLLGVGALFVGWAVRRRAGLIAAGVGTAALGVGVVVQIAAAPW